MLTRRAYDPQLLPLSLPLRAGLLLTQPDHPLLPPIQLGHFTRLDANRLLHPGLVAERKEEVEGSVGLGGVEVLQGRDVEVVVCEVGDEHRIERKREERKAYSGCAR